MNSNYKSGFVAVVGRPNVGKSSIVNAILGQKLAIISSKPQTTRNNILAISTDEKRQIIFVDTPGIHMPKTKLGAYMVNAAKEGVRDADIALFVTEAGRDLTTGEEKIIEDLNEKEIPSILIINKTDTVDKPLLLPQIDKIGRLMNFAAIIPVSAKKGSGISKITEEVEKLLPEGPMFYPEDTITDMNTRQVAAEIIREKILGLLNQEVPHGIAVEIDTYKEEEKLISIEAAICCEKNSHKGMIIGKGGQTLKKIGERAREDIEKMEGRKVFLKLFVKVQEDWRNNSRLIKNFGYE